MISNFKLIARILQNSLLDWKPISVLPIADLLVVANDADRPSLLGDKYFSPNVDLIAYIAPTVAIGIARILDIKTHPKTLIPVYALSGLFCRALIAKHLHSLFKRLLCLNSHYSFSNAESKLWIQVIGHVRPRAILAINPSRELCHASFISNIPCIEVQHGIIYPSHPYYSSTRMLEPDTWLPSGYVVWTAYSQEVIKRLYIDKAKPSFFILGNILQTCLENSFRLQEMFNSYCSSPNLRNSSDLRPVILVTLSWGMDMHGGEIISNEYIKLINMTSSAYRWIVRLHPAQISGHRKFEYYEFLRSFLPRLPQEVYADEYNKTPLSLLANSVQLHLTEMSSSVIDLSFMNIRSIVTHHFTESNDIFGKSIFDQYVLYKPGANSSELKACIEQALAEQTDCNPSDTGASEPTIELNKLLSFLVN